MSGSEGSTATAWALPASSNAETQSTRPEMRPERSVFVRGSKGVLADRVYTGFGAAGGESATSSSGMTFGPMGANVAIDTAL